MPQVRNPILPGFNADPAIVRVGEDGKYLCSMVAVCIVLIVGSAYMFPTQRQRYCPLGPS